MAAQRSNVGFHRLDCCSNFKNTCFILAVNVAPARCRRCPTIFLAPAAPAMTPSWLHAQGPSAEQVPGTLIGGRESFRLGRNSGNQKVCHADESWWSCGSCASLWRRHGPCRRPMGNKMARSRPKPGVASAKADEQAAEDGPGKKDTRLSMKDIQGMRRYQAACRPSKSPTTSPSGDVPSRSRRRSPASFAAWDSALRHY